LLATGHDMIRDRGDYDFSDYQVETKTPIYVSVFLGVIFIAAAIIAIASSLALECPDGPKSCVFKSSKALFLGCEPYLDGKELDLCKEPLIDGRPSSNCKLFCNRVYARQFPMYVGIATGFLSLAVTGYLCYKVIKNPDGTPKMKEIAAAIQQGAYTFLRQEYTALVFFVIPACAAVALLLGVSKRTDGKDSWKLAWQTALSFLVGAIVSGATGINGMYVATKSNVRTAAAATDPKEGLNKALRVAFDSGATMGLGVVGSGVLFLSFFYLVTDEVQVLHGFAFGSSCIALFARVGGGIYTKAADVGTDLVGKVEAGIPEDDPRNPGVIADNVGDNVGDVAGMGADLFESYVGSIVSAITLGSQDANELCGERPGVPSDVCFDPLNARFNGWGVGLPVLLASIGIVASIIGTQLVRTKEGATQNDLLGAIRNATLVSAALFVGASIPLFTTLGFGWSAWGAMALGLIAGILIGQITEYYTSYDCRPTQRISEAGVTGPATVVIEGFGVGMESTFMPVMVAALSIYGSLRLYGPYGVSLSAVGMLSTLGITLATDAYGPVADNAGGIAEMSGLGHEIRKKTDTLDSLGNTTAAVGKGFAVGSAMLTSLALLDSFLEEAFTNPEDRLINLAVNKEFVPSLLIGGMLPFLFSSMTMLAVGKSAGAIIDEIRRQFREIPGLLEGREDAKADYAKCVEISTKAALREMLIPGALAVLAPVMVGLTFGPNSIVGMLMGSLVSSTMLAITMGNAGGAWDNAKKYVEGYSADGTGTQTYLGGKGTDLHKAVVCGDTCGDPFKDTSGPALNILLKQISLTALVLASPIGDVESDGCTKPCWRGLIAIGVSIIILGGLRYLVSKMGGDADRNAMFLEAQKKNAAQEAKRDN